jgi:hypothetical protein
MSNQMIIIIFGVLGLAAMIAFNWDKIMSWVGSANPQPTASTPNATVTVGSNALNQAESSANQAAQSFGLPGLPQGN